MTRLNYRLIYTIQLSIMEMDLVKGRKGVWFINSKQFEKVDFRAIGRRIAYYRTVAELTQEDLAEKLEFTPGHVSNIETGKNQVTLTTLIHIANLLNTPIEMFTADVIDNNKSARLQEVASIFDDTNRSETQFLICELRDAKRNLRDYASSSKM